MDSKVHYTVVGLFVIVLGTVLVAVFFWFAAIKHDKVYKTYLIYTDEDVTGLTVDSPVRYNGVPVGFVRKIELDPDNPRLVRLVLAIESGTPVTTSTVAVLRSQGITGVVYVGLIAETENAPPLVPRPGEYYPVIPARPSLFVQLSEVIPRLTKTMTEISTNVNKLLSSENRTAVANTLQSMDKFTQMLADNARNLDASIKSLRITLHNTSVASSKLPATIDQIDSALKSVQHTSDAVRDTAQEFGKSARQMTATFANGEVAIKGISNQIVPSMQQLMMRLNNISANVQQLSTDLNQNPSILVRGKYPDAPGPGEQR